MRSTRQRVLLAVVACLVLASMMAGCGRRTVAKVDGSRITRDEYFRRLERLPYVDPSNGQRTEAGAFVLQQMVEEILILRLAEKEGVAPTEDQVKARTEEIQKQPSFRQANVPKEQLKELMKVEQAIFNLQTKGVKVTDKEVKDYYEQNKEAQFTIPEQGEFRAIFTKDKAGADKAMEMLKKGVKFEVVARTLSEHATKEQGGLLPPMTRNRDDIPAEVRDKMFSLKPNQYSEPIADGGGGYVIFQMLKHQKERTQKFKEVEFAIKDALMRQKGSEKNSPEKIKQAMDDLRAKADISVNIDRYKSMSTKDKDKAETKEEAEKPEAENKDKE